MRWENGVFLKAQVFFFSEPSEGYSQGIIPFVQQMMLRYIIYQLLKSLKFMHSGQAPADARMRQLWMLASWPHFVFDLNECGKANLDIHK